jgi:phosphatidylinositol alpha-1,6-mannosyltransferase
VERGGDVAKVTIVSTEWTGGGIGRVLTEIALLCQAAGIADSPLSPRPGFRHIPRNALAAHGRSSTFLFGTWLAALWQGYIVTGKQRSTKPAYVVAHGVELAPLGGRRPSRFVAGRIFSESRGVLCNSSYLRGRLDALLPGVRTAFIPFGVDSLRFAPQDEAVVQAIRESLMGRRRDERSLVLIVARLVRRKGHLRLLSALAQIPVARRPFLAIVGRGPAVSDIRHAIRALGVSEDVIMLGDVPDEELPCLYSASDVFAMPTLPPPPGSWDFEGYGMVYLEAAACGTPVIAGDVGGVRDAVQTPEMGWLLPSTHDCEDELIELLKQPRDVLRRRGELAKEYTRAHRQWQQTLAGLRAFMGV